jgi:hypothetical protein
MQLNNINHLWRSACQPGADGTLESLYNEKVADFEKAIKDTDTWLGLRSED